MSRLGPTIVVRGELSSAADLSIEGTVDGPIWCEGHAVIVSEGARVTGDIVGRDITVAGRVIGTLLASEIVDLRQSAEVRGRIVSASLVLHEGALFHGDVQPQQVDTALTVARHRRSQAGAAPPSTR
jgi:cytoskeletal protein CcmA (bactofilin family)